MLCSSNVLHIMCHNSAHLTSSGCHWIVVKMAVFVVHPAAMWEKYLDLNTHTQTHALQHLPQCKHQSEQSFARLLHLQSSRLKIGQWLISYWGQWIEDDLNGSSEAKCRLSGAAVSTKNSFIDRLSTSFSLNLLSLSAFPTPVLCDCQNHTFSEQQTEKQSEAHTHLHAQVLSCTSSSEQSAAMGSPDCQTHCVSKRKRGVRTHWQLWDDWTVNSWLLSCYECLDVLLPN